MVARTTAPRPRRRTARHPASSHRLPATLTRLFWDYPGQALTLGRDRELVVRRVAIEGGLREIRVLRSHLTDEAIREVLLCNGVRGMSPQRIRFWQLLLDLPARRADAWVRVARAGTWARRRRQ
jgi:hypothetical protein